MNSNRRKIKISAILLAAGGSWRLGVPKQLLKWQGKPLISFIIDQINQVEFSSTFVILGGNSNEIKKVIGKQKVKFISNPFWQNGIGTSIRAGIKTLPNDISAVIIFVVDQPYLSPDLINKIIRVYVEEKAQIVAPVVNGVQTNPVLFDQSVFDVLMTLKDDEGAKKILNSFKLRLLKWNDKWLLMDIDTIEDYRLLISNGYSSKSPL